MNDPARPILVPFHAVDEDGGPFLKDGQAFLLARALELANVGASQEAIMATLQAEHPGKPNENYYLNPAAEAVMRRVVRERKAREGLEKDIARLRADGKPEAWAYTQRGLPIPLSVPEPEDESPVPRPAWTGSDQSDWHGPLHSEVLSCRNVWELLSLCERYDLTISLAGVDLQLSRRIAKDSDLFAALVRAKPQIVALLEAQARPIGDFE